MQAAQSDLIQLMACNAAHRHKAVQVFGIMCLVSGWRHHFFLSRFLATLP